MIGERMLSKIMKKLPPVIFGLLTILSMWNLYLCFVTENGGYTDVWIVLSTLCMFKLTEEIER